jgi:alpha-galactosidase
MIKAFSLTLLLATGALAAPARNLPDFRDLTAPDLWQPSHVPFAFKYGGKDSAQLLSSWQTSDEIVPTSSGGLIHRYTYTDPVTKLTVTAEVRTVHDFPAVDWIVKFRNDGTADTPIIEDIAALRWSAPAAPGDCIVHHARGSNADAQDFMPLD